MRHCGSKPARYSWQCIAPKMQHKNILHPRPRNNAPKMHCTIEIALHLQRAQAWTSISSLCEQIWRNKPIGGGGTPLIAAARIRSWSTIIFLFFFCVFTLLCFNHSPHCRPCGQTCQQQPKLPVPSFGCFLNRSLIFIWLKDIKGDFAKIFGMEIHMSCFETI